MSKRLGMVVVLAAAMLWIPVATAQEQSVEAIQKAVAEKMDGLKSLSSPLALNVEVKLNPDMPNPLKLVGGGSVDYLKKGDKPLYRADIWAGFSETAPKMAQAQSAYDGKLVHYDVFIPLAKIDETGTVDPGESFKADANVMFAELRKYVDLTALPPAQLGDTDVYVLEGKPKEGTDWGPVAKVRISFAQDTGIPLKVAIVGADDTDMGTLSMTGLKVNGELSEDNFKIVPFARPIPPAPKPEASDQADSEADQK